MNDSDSHRRDFLTGKALHSEVRRQGDAIADSLIGHTQATPPSGGDTLRLTTRAMACDFSVIMNGGEHDNVWDASAALDLFHGLERQLSVYRDDSEVSRLNATAADESCVVETRLFRLLQESQQLATDTDGAFDLTTNPLIELWRECRGEARAPSSEEVTERMQRVGMHHVSLDPAQTSVRFALPGVSINLGAIGKGYALDQAAELLEAEGLETMLLHGGHSSLLAKGNHNRSGGWPVGLGNPLFTKQRLGTIVLKDQAMGTSGSNIQYFRVGGERYGHILDPRTGWPVEETLSVTVVASSATLADALSTAFYVMGPEAARAYCRTHPEVGAIFIPRPRRDRRVRPQVVGIDPEQLYWDAEQIAVETLEP